MSDTEREAFEAWWDRNMTNGEVRAFFDYKDAFKANAWIAWKERARRSTTTEARAPLSDEEIDAIWKPLVWYDADCERLDYREFARRVAARAPAPPSDAPTDDRIRHAWRCWPHRAVTGADRAVEFVRFVLATDLCACRDRPAKDCPGEWEQGCDLGANEKFVRVAGPPAPSAPSKE